MPAPKATRSQPLTAVLAPYLADRRRLRAAGLRPSTPRSAISPGSPNRLGCHWPAGTCCASRHPGPRWSASSGRHGTCPGRPIGSRCGCRIRPVRSHPACSPSGWRSSAATRRDPGRPVRPHSGRSAAAGHPRVARHGVVRRRLDRGGTRGIRDSPPHTRRGEHGPRHAPRPQGDDRPDQCLRRPGGGTGRLRSAVPSGADTGAAGTGSVFVGGSLHRQLGQLAALLGQTEQALSHFAQAVTINTRIGARPFVALARLDWAAALRTRAAHGDFGQARALARQAATEARRLDMPGPAARAERLARDLEQAIQAADPLTRREREIAALVSAGVTEPSHRRRAGAIRADHRGTYQEHPDQAAADQQDRTGRLGNPQRRRDGDVACALSLARCVTPVRESSPWMSIIRSSVTVRYVTGQRRRLRREGRVTRPAGYWRLCLN